MRTLSPTTPHTYTDTQAQEPLGQEQPAEAALEAAGQDRAQHEQELLVLGWASWGSGFFRVLGL